MNFQEETNMPISSNDKKLLELIKQKDLLVDNSLNVIEMIRVTKNQNKAPKKITAKSIPKAQTRQSQKPPVNSKQKIENKKNDHQNESKNQDSENLNSLGFRYNYDFLDDTTGKNSKDFTLFKI